MHQLMLRKIQRCFVTVAILNAARSSLSELEKDSVARYNLFLADVVLCLLLPFKLNQRFLKPFLVSITDLEP